jgi:hypothetical protein
MCWSTSAGSSGLLPRSRPASAPGPGGGRGAVTSTRFLPPPDRRTRPGTPRSPGAIRRSGLQDRMPGARSRGRSAGPQVGRQFARMGSAVPRGALPPRAPRREEGQRRRGKEAPRLLSASTGCSSGQVGSDKAEGWPSSRPWPVPGASFALTHLPVLRHPAACPGIPWAAPRSSGLARPQ